jgi:hypothetical protein
VSNKQRDRITKPVVLPVAMMLQQGLAMANADLFTYLIYVLGAVIFAGIAAAKWAGKQFRDLMNWLRPLVTDFFEDQKLTMHTARESLTEMAKTTATIQVRIDNVHQTLGQHGEKLACIEKRTQHLHPGVESH